MSRDFWIATIAFLVAAVVLGVSPSESDRFCVMAGEVEAPQPVVHSPASYPPAGMGSTSGLPVTIGDHAASHYVVANDLLYRDTGRVTISSDEARWTVK